jgi:HlyD family secretion protein
MPSPSLFSLPRIFSFFSFFSFFLLLLGCHSAKEVETLRPERTSIQESFTEPARTRLSQTYEISMPVEGRIARIPLKPGDPVKKGQVLVELERLPYELQVQEARAAVEELEASITLKKYNDLEETLRIEVDATIKAAQEALKTFQAQIEAEQARWKRANEHLARIRALNQADKVSQSDYEDALLQSETALIELRKQEFNLATYKAIMIAIHLGPQMIDQWLIRKSLEKEVLFKQLTQAKMRLLRAEHTLSLASILSPLDGIVLQKFEQGDGTLPPGRTLCTLGNLQDLEVVAEVLTQDALKLHQGTQIILEINSQELPGSVKQIEPYGFTKLSSLGVEQQRVKVVIQMKNIPPALGVGYQLYTRFITQTRDQTLTVPRYSVLQAPDHDFYVFKIQQEKLVRHPVKIGLQSDLFLEITEGLQPNDVLLAYPEATTPDQLSVKMRPLKESP